ncbi:hypothetical protein J31TS4_11160 [Paenibacillus sp. J31TS4]|uniref:GreA/GreB family elongation factor n=1 Tax=Paenibacillus sp. J31TS4 TaxID=2807195 RepID=UPI001B01C147|nr:GreA/GreB family elongation factor [Paenibacillus sp. J31TS4]GIP37836.1 hypothetical protein J31TS4_11160 [Paenibacillus sp. J31TS4]
MNPSPLLQDSRAQLSQQLAYFEADKTDFMDRYYPSPGRERTRVGELLSLYTNTLGALLAKELDETAFLDTVLIGSEVELFYLDDQFTETYTIVFPQQADPNENKISFLSPIGIQLLMAPLQVPIPLQVPSGSLQVRIERVRYADCGRCDEEDGRTAAILPDKGDFL